MSKDFFCPKCGRKMHRAGKTPSGRACWRCDRREAGARIHCYSTTSPESKVPLKQNGTTDAPGKRPQFKRKLGGVKRFVITSAQNATPVHRPFFSALLAYCQENDAALIVVPLRYKNPTSRWTESQVNEERWDPILAPYLYNQRKKLCANLVLLGDIKTQPTAVRPLTGYEAITHGESGILGHTKLQLATIPTPQGKFPKILTTTGAITIPNYTDSRAGKLGEFHHVQAAVAVDISGSKFHLRQINATSAGSFIDLQKEYHPHPDTAGFVPHKARTGGGEPPPGTVSPAPRALALVMGDTHRQAIDKAVEHATFGPGGIVETLDPEYLVFHDLHDGYAENPHHRGNPFSALAKLRSGKNNVQREVLEDVRWLERVCAGRKGVLVSSNHDDFLTRWIMQADWKADPENAEFYLETALQMVRLTQMTDTGTRYIAPFPYWVHKLKDPTADIRCLMTDESFMLADVELSMHGDRGPNGSRGSRMNLRRIGVKSVIGHGHGPGIDEGCTQVGTNTPLRQEYTSGPSNWLQTDCVLYGNGKRCLINIINGEWKL